MKVSTEGFQHLNVNHKYNFVDPESGAHTQNIERTWRDIKDSIPKYGRRQYHYTGYFAEFLFKRQYKFQDRLDAFFTLLSEYTNVD